MVIMFSSSIDCLEKRRKHTGESDEGLSRVSSQNSVTRGEIWRKSMQGNVEGGNLHRRENILNQLRRVHHRFFPWPTTARYQNEYEFWHEIFYGHVKKINWNINWFSNFFDHFEKKWFSWLTTDQSGLRTKICVGKDFSGSCPTFEKNYFN